MKIELEFPFNDIWRHGYIVINKENRRMVCLVNSKTFRTTISYARYLMCVKERRILAKNEHVDHINDDKTNDSIENLQILTQRENIIKSCKTGETINNFICPICSKKFELTARQSHKINPTCSRRCGGIKSHMKNKIADKV